MLRYSYYIGTYVWFQDPNSISTQFLTNTMNNSNIIMYTTEDGLTKIEVTFEEDTVWLSLEQMTELFQRNKSTISRHIKNVFSEGELQQESTVAKFATVQTEEAAKWLTRDEMDSVDWLPADLELIEKIKAELQRSKDQMEERKIVLIGY